MPEKVLYDLVYRAGGTCQNSLVHKAMSCKPIPQTQVEMNCLPPELLTVIIQKVCSTGSCPADLCSAACVSKAFYEAVQTPRCSRAPPPACCV